MKNKITLFIAILFLGIATYGQNHGKPDYDKIRSLKVAYFTERLDLSSTEAETFWPVYNEYEKTRHQLGRTQRKEFFSKLNDENISEKQAAALLDKHLDIEEKEEELDKAFTLKMKKIIGAKKTLILLKSEKDFQTKLLREYRKKHGGKTP